VAKSLAVPARDGPEGKAIVAAVLQRGGKVRAKVVDTRKKKDVQAIVRENVEPKSALYSDMRRWLATAALEGGLPAQSRAPSAV
jgi:ISXO2 transposase-like protein